MRTPGKPKGRPLNKSERRKTMSVRFSKSLLIVRLRKQMDELEENHHLDLKNGYAQLGQGFCGLPTSLIAKAGAYFKYRALERLCNDLEDGRY